MGKKRRLKSAKAKFKTKHSSHPRMQLLNAANTNVIVEEAVEAPVEVTVAPVPVVLEEEKTVVAPPSAPIAQEKAKAATKPKAKTPRKRRAPRKTKKRAPKTAATTT